MQWRIPAGDNLAGRFHVERITVPIGNFAASIFDYRHEGTEIIGFEVSFQNNIDTTISQFAK